MSEREKFVDISEVKHDVYGKRQTANGKIETFPASNQLCIE